MWTKFVFSVIINYCLYRKSPQLKGCIMGFVNSTNQCLTEEERGSKQLIQNVTDQLLGFVCFKEGDRIACKFISFSSTMGFKFVT